MRVHPRFAEQVEPVSYVWYSTLWDGFLFPPLINREVSQEGIDEANKEHPEKTASFFLRKDNEHKLLLL